MKTADKGKEYQNDKEFLINSFLWAGLTNKNRCISNLKIKNEFCFEQNTMADAILSKFKMDDDNEKILNHWRQILQLAKAADEYNDKWTYGLLQIDKEINIKVGSGTFNKMGKEIQVPKYRKLDEHINVFKLELKQYYETKLKPKLFEYELLK